MIKKINLERESASPKNKVMLGALLGGKRAEKHKILKEEQVKMRNEEATSLMKGLLALMPSDLLRPPGAAGQPTTRNYVVLHTRG